MTDPSDGAEPEYQTLGDWCVHMGLDGDEVAALLAANPGRRPGDALTAGEVADLFGPVTPPPLSEGRPG